MGGIAEGWKLKPDKRTGILSVRFRHKGKRYDVSTGTRDAGQASVIAAQKYADVVTGGQRSVARSTLDLESICAKFATAIAPELDERTAYSYARYAFGLFVPFFQTLEGFTEARIADYVRKRLSEVTRRTVRRELSGLRRLLSWCKEQGRIAALPTFPVMPRKAMGVRKRLDLKEKSVRITADEAARFLAALPEWSHTNRRRFAVRARLVVAYETTLRPATLAAIRAPEHYRRGASELVVIDEDDKARFGRTLPLTDAARAALDSVCPDEGPIFGDHRFARFIKKAAAEAGLAAEKVRWLSSYDLRHGRIKHMLDAGAPLTGVAYLAGHMRLTTTNQYVAVDAAREQAERSLRVGPLGGANFGESTSTEKTRGVMGKATRMANATESEKTPAFSADSGGATGENEARNAGASPLPGGIARSVFGLAYLRATDPDEWLLALAGEE